MAPTHIDPPAIGEMTARLTPQQRMFVKAYPVSLCGTTAAKVAGYKDPGGASKQLMRKPHIKRAIEKGRQEAEKKFEELVPFLMDDLLAMVRFDPTDVVKIKSGLVEVADTDKLPPHVRRCIIEIAQTRDGPRVRFINKTKVFELACRIAGLLKDNVNVESTVRMGLLADLTEEEIDRRLAKLDEKEAAARKEDDTGADASSGVHALRVVDAP